MVVIALYIGLCSRNIPMTETVFGEVENVIALYIGLCSHDPEINKYFVFDRFCKVIALYIGLCSQQYLLLFFFSFYHFSLKKQAFLQKKWVSRFSCHFKKSSIYACFRIYLYFFTTLLSVDPLFYKINFILSLKLQQ